MEAQFDVLLNRSIPEKRSIAAQHAAKSHISPSHTGRHGLNASAQKQQIIVPSCSTGSFKASDSSSTVKKNLAPIAVVLSKDQRVSTKSKLLLSPPLLFLSNGKNKKGNTSSNAKSKTQHAQRPPNLYAKTTTSHFGKKEARRGDRDSSVEAEDSLGTLLSKHFETDTSEDNVRSPNSVIANRRILHEKARIRHICSVCNRECPSKHKLRRHLSTHTEDRPFACEACGKSFKWIGYLQKHVRQQHSNCIDLSPTSPLMTPSSAQSHVTPDTPIFSASPSPPHIFIHQKRHKKRKSKTKQSKSSRNRLFSEALIASCSSYPRHRKKTKSLSVEVTSSVLYESESSQHSKKNGTVDSLIVSIPRFPKASSVGVDMESEESPLEKDAIDLTMDTINVSSRIGQNELAPNFSNAVNAIMAEPVPSNFIQGNRTASMNSSSGMGAGFSKDYLYSFPLNSTSNNNSDSLLVQDYGHSQLLNPGTQNSYSPGLLQQPNLSTQSESTPIDMSTSVQPKVSMDYSLQQEAQSNTDSAQSRLSLSNSSMQPPDLIAMSSQFDQIGSDLQFEQQLNDMMDFNYSDPLQNQYSMYNNQVFDGDALPVLDDIGMPGLDYIPSSGLGALDNFMASPSYLDMQQARHLLYENSQQMQRILRSYQSLQNTLLRVTAGNILSSGSSFNGLLDDQGLVNNPLQQPNLNSVPINQQNQQLLMNNIQQQTLVDQVPQSGSQITKLQSNMNQPQVQMQDYLSQPPINRSSNQIIQDQANQLPNQQQLQLNQSQETDSTAPLLQNLISHSHTNQMQPQNVITHHSTQQKDDLLQELQSMTTTTSQSPIKTTAMDIFDNPTCEPDDLLTPIIREDYQEIDYSPSQTTCELDDLLTPTIREEIDYSPSSVEIFARLDNDSNFDVGIQCELGPETLVALIEEEAQEEYLEPNADPPSTLSSNVLANLLVNGPSTLLAKSSPSLLPKSSALPVASAPPVLLSRVPPTLQTISTTDMLATLQTLPVMSSGAKKPTIFLTNAQILSSPVFTRSTGTETLKVDRMVNKYRCEIEGCTKAYLHRKDLTRHMKIRHGAYVQPKMLKPIAVETAEKPYICPIVSCGRSYHHMRDLRRHQRNCHSENSKTEDSNGIRLDHTKEYSLYGKIQLRFPCDFPGCVRSYVHKKDLIRHKRLYHKDLSCKPSVPIRLPYSDTDLRQMKKTRQNTIGSSCNSFSSTSTDTTGVLSPDVLMSTLNSDVFLSLGVVPPLIEQSGDTHDFTGNSNTAQLLTLIQNLTSSNAQQVEEVPYPKLSAPITVPNVTGCFLNEPISSSKPQGGSSCETLKYVLSKPNKASTTQSEIVQAQKANETFFESPTSDISSILDFSAKDLVDSLKPQTLKVGETKRSPDTLANLAVEALSRSASELSCMLVTTVPSPTPSSASLITTPEFSMQSMPTIENMIDPEFEITTPESSMQSSMPNMIDPEFDALSSPFERFSPAADVQLDDGKTLVDLDAVLEIGLVNKAFAELSKNLPSTDSECSILIA